MYGAAGARSTLAPVVCWTVDKAEQCSLGTGLPKVPLSCMVAAIHRADSASRTNLWRGRPK